MASLRPVFDGANSVKVLILGLNYAPEPIGIGPYTTGLAGYLAERGHQVSVLAGNPYYPDWQLMDGFAPQGSASVEAGVTVRRIYHFIPRKPSGLKRIAHHLSFAKNAARAVRQVEHADLVLAIAPSLLAAPVGLAAARRMGAKTWLHIQDFEVEAAIATGLLSSGFAKMVGSKFERSIISRFDGVSSISAAMTAKAKAMSSDRASVVELRNWSDNAVKPSNAHAPELRAELGLDERPVALYSGNLSLKQGCGLIAEAAQILAKQSNVQFVVCGAGSAHAEMASAAKTLPNLLVTDLLQRDKLNALLSMADVHILTQIEGAANLVLPSKLTNMLASGRPVVATAAPGTDLANEVEGCGLVTPPGDAATFAGAIKTLVEDADLRRQLGHEAALRASERWSGPVLLEEFALCLENAVAEQEPK